jgi:hypothetical protein
LNQRPFDGHFSIDFTTSENCEAKPSNGWKAILNYFDGGFPSA